MSTTLAVILAALSLPPGQSEAGGVRIEVEIHAHLYVWKVMNIDAPPIVRFEMEQQGSTEQIAPDGWELEIDGPRYLAWTDDPRFAIPRGQWKQFEARVKSTGAVLGLVPVELGFAKTDVPLVLENVWAPVSKRRSMVVLVAFAVVALAALHTIILERRGCEEEQG